MNDNIDLTKILKDCPRGTKLYSTIFGEVEFEFEHIHCGSHLILCKAKTERTFDINSDGKMFSDYEREYTLFPSKDQRDWSKFTAPWYKKDKFDPKTLKPFDRIIVRNNNGEWECAIFSHIKDYGHFYRYDCCYMIYRYCIPYNYETEHLVDTTEEAPEYYRCWED